MQHPIPKTKIQVRKKPYLATLNTMNLKHEELLHMHTPRDIRHTRHMTHATRHAQTHTNTHATDTTHTTTHRHTDTHDAPNTHDGHDTTRTARTTHDTCGTHTDTRHTDARSSNTHGTHRHTRLTHYTHRQWDTHAHSWTDTHTTQDTYSRQHIHVDNLQHPTWPHRQNNMSSVLAQVSLERDKNVLFAARIPRNTAITSSETKKTIVPVENIA
jgi:hypothetical protein